MKQVLSILLLIALYTQANAQDSTLFPKGQIGANKDDYTGTIWLNELNHPDSTFAFSLAQAVYAPGSKLNWHIHPAGQYLLITQGTGYYQEKKENRHKSFIKATLLNDFPVSSIGMAQHQTATLRMWVLRLLQKAKQFG